MSETPQALRALAAGVLVGIVIVAGAYLAFRQPGVPGAYPGGSSWQGATEGATAVPPGGGGSSGAASLPSSGSQGYVELEFRGGLPAFKSWSDITRIVKTYTSQPWAGYQLYRAAEPIYTSLPESGARAYTVAMTSQPYSETNVQVPGVGEPDTVRTNGTHIFIVDRGTVDIYVAYPPEKLGRIAEVDVCSYIEEHTENLSVALIADNGSVVRILGRLKPVYCGVRGLYTLPNGSIVVLAEEQLASGVWEERTWALMISPNTSISTIYWVSGRLSGSRLYNGTLVLVTSVPSVSGGVVTRPATSAGVLEASQVYLVGTPNYHVLVSAISLESGAAETVSLLGPGPSTLYMSGGGDLYVALGRGLVEILRILDAARPGSPAEIPLSQVIAPSPRAGSTVVARLSIEPGSVEPDGYTVIRGWIGSQWQMNEADGYLYIVTEEGGNVSLYVIDTEAMNVTASLGPIAVRERIKAVRLVGDTLYLVTYRIVDPLFAINISDPAHPKVIGFLEAPGFDAYLHPLGQNILLGVGYEDGRVRVSLYKILPNGTPTVIDRIYLNTSYTPVLTRLGHRAFVYYEEKRLVILPFMGPDGSGAAIINTSQERLSLTAILYHVKGGKAWIPMRALYIGDYIYTITETPARGVPRIIAWNLNPRLYIAGQA